MKASLGVFWSITCLMLAGCAFDLAHVKQAPTTLQTDVENLRPWILDQEIKVHIGTGYGTVLKARTRWQPAGRIREGDVFKTQDQIVKVEAPNIHEAYVVVKEGMVVGFYLPVERTFTAARPPKPIAKQHSNSNQLQPATAL